MYIVIIIAGVCYTIGLEEDKPILTAIGLIILLFCLGIGLVLTLIYT